MKQCIFFCICCTSLFTLRLQGQQNHFIYLQTENKQPFYVKLENNILSSSISGYLIVPKLREGTYSFTLGFPKKEWDEQKFSCTVTNTDAGYLVKNFGEKGWGLFNLQTLDITMSGAPKVLEQENKTDEFSTLLSSAVNDPKILKKDAVEPALVLKDTVKAPPVENKIPPTPPQPVVTVEAETKEVPATITVANDVDEIRKIQELSTAEATSKTYIVKANGVSDTVMISIPLLLEEKTSAVDTVIKVKGAIAAAAQKETVEHPAVVAKAADTSLVESQAAKEKFLPIDMAPAVVKADTALTVNKQNETKDVTATEEKPAVTITNSDCLSNASDEDFLKIRKKMASASADEDMMGIAKKAFKQKCFSTDQIKNLGVLFLKDEGRYNFFDLAYPHVWDSSNYKLLENQLADPYYANRFKAMIRH